MDKRVICRSFTDNDITRKLQRVHTTNYTVIKPPVLFVHLNYEKTQPQGTVRYFNPPGFRRTPKNDECKFIRQPKLNPSL